MLGLLASALNISTRMDVWTRPDLSRNHDGELFHHEVRKREELHKQQEHAKWFRREG
ncbi:MAG: hypothetical protein GXP05_05585 [Alphaproteobacteria bacterium]|nr:hypothetical protein [Alphaproteobacteria bacterium]